MTILLLWVFCLFPSLLHAATHQVGATRTLKTPAAAALIAQSGDTIEFDPELFSNGGAIWNASNLLLKSIGGRATITGPSVGGKALWLLVGSNITVENLIIQGAVVLDGNGAAIKTEGRNYTFLSNIIRWNQMGILTGGPLTANSGSKITMKYNEIYENGTGDGYTHNVYISAGDELDFRYNWSYCSTGGQLLKSRVRKSLIAHNRLVDQPGCTSNQEVDFSNGGEVIFVGNLVRQDPLTTNSGIITYLSEGPGTNTIHEITFVNNTIIQTRDPVGPFFHYRGILTQTPEGPLYTPPIFKEIKNNFFVGKGAILAYTTAPTKETTQVPQPIPPDNIVIPLLADAKFLDGSNHQFRLQSTSPAIDKGWYPTGDLALLLSTQYAHPAGEAPRTLTGLFPDAGAYEYNNTPPPGKLYPIRLNGELSTPPNGTLRWWPLTVEGGSILYEVRENNIIIATQPGLTLTKALQPGIPTTFTVTPIVNGARAPTSNPFTLSLPRKSATIPPEVGWTEILGTNFNTICKTYGAVQGHTGCRSIIDAFSSAAFDPLEERMIYFGGGHKDYFGNEIYTVNLKTNLPKITRITPPTQPVTTYEYCAEGLPYLLSSTNIPLPYKDPSSRHTFDGLTFITHANTFFSFGGALACYASWTSNSFWFLNMTTLKWEERQPDVELFNKTTQTWVKSTQPLADRPQRQEGAMVDYDTEKKLVIISDKVCLYTYNYDTNTIRRLSCQKDFMFPQLGYINTGIFDPDTRKFHVLGAKEHYVYSVDPPYTAARVGLTGDHTMANAYYPGLTYDTLRKQIVGWDGGDSIWRFDYSKNQWLSTWFPAGPGSRNPTGTYKRFKYIPGKDYFWLTNNGNQNMFTLRLPSITTPPIFKGLLNILIGNTP